MTWFSNSYGAKICQTFLVTGFPYVTLNNGGRISEKVKKHKTDMDVVLDLFGDCITQSDNKCSKQNIDLCYIYFLLSKYTQLPMSVKVISVYINSTYLIVNHNHLFIIIVFNVISRLFKFV